ncbi:MAG: hypothetical protein COV02_01135 [Candidatus Terrybacteria bacterium CG10_big_fil_rev_8_21_14_0_10_41_10]|uniref:DUF8128 domain-containing protein n=1 Tax=Candidatus Terrybacteria bacterium CG10_big_fil_rev_8_21_14_0_10_41_10 TaxID=1975026 RepID=A0A2M8LAR0_9BACT|nr:MAG: hypothetical protein COV02_01135 [Candidatus Terrybacteria bacterium CG10_big_fil_rev_8_21_14_0_10_41_10]
MSREDELEYLRKKVKDLELSKPGGDESHHEAVREVVKGYAEEKPDYLLAEKYKMSQDEVFAESERIFGGQDDSSEETHLGHVAQLVSLAREKGVLNAITVAARLDPHLEDDFHDSLVESLHGVLAGAKVGNKKVKRSLEFVLYEISMPSEAPKEMRNGEDDFKKAISAMEQFYAGMSAMNIYYILEIGLPFVGDEVSFYCAVTEENGHIFEKQAQGVFPHLKITRKFGDYNIFKPEGFSLGSVARLKKNPVLPLKNYNDFGIDPMRVVLNAFTKFQKDGEGAALQMVVMPSKNDLSHKVSSVIHEMRKGESFGAAVGNGGGFMGVISDLILGSGKQKSKDALEEKNPADEQTIKLLEFKSSKQISPVNFRLAVSAKESEERARKMLEELEISFAQFAEPMGNSLSFARPKGSKLRKFFHSFSYRMPSKDEEIELNVSELASILHLPFEEDGMVSHQLKQNKAKEHPAPLNLPNRGLMLGKNIYRGEEKPVFIKDEDRRRHFYVIGQTGTGKSVLLKNMIIQDIEAGKGVCFMDPHGQDLQDIFSRIPQHRIDDVIYFDPGNVNRPLGLNMLEYDTRFPEQKTFIVNELLMIFDKLFDMKTSGGPMFEQYFRNSVLLVMDDPASGNTLFEVSRVLSNKDFREFKLSRTSNPIVKSFWRDVADKAGGEASLANMVPYITSKFDNFLSNDIMRPIIGQEKSAFKIRDVMDEGKILLVNLSKGRLGDLNAGLLGLILVGKILMASLSRADISEEDRKDFYLYIDEFQNITTDSISSILSEARKYKLNLIIAHQFISQLKESISKSVFGNVGSMAAFRVGAEDAEFLEKQFSPTFNAHDIMNMDNYNAYLKILIDGQISKPFSVKTTPFEKGDLAYGSGVAEISSLKYGRDRSEVEEEIRKKY